MDLAEPPAPPPPPPPPFLEVSCQSSGMKRRFALGTEAGFALSLINKKLGREDPLALHIEAVKEGEEPIVFGPSSVLVDYGNGWRLQTVTQMAFSGVGGAEVVGIGGGEEVVRPMSLPLPDITQQEGDASTQGNEVGTSVFVVDYTKEFTTDEIFKSKDELVKWTRVQGRKNGLVVIIRRSDGGGLGNKRPRIKFGCERHGLYKSKKSDTNDQESDANGQEGKRRRSTGTKKCGCPFILKGTNIGGDEWKLEVICGVHNHPAAMHLERHSYAGRLSEEENALLVDMSKSLVKPKDILHTIKQRDALNVTTMKHIYNARQRNRVKEQVGRSEMQILLSKLEEHKYVEWHRSYGANNIVSDLFWAHPASVDVLRSFPHVLIIDCTYKTNRYRFPLLEMVGVTSTNMTFSAAFVCLDAEKEDNYTWALSRLKYVLNDDSFPSVIVTDCDLALMNAIHNVFPSARHLLCRWHISRAVLARCKNVFGRKDMCDNFIMGWNMLVCSETEDEYQRNLKGLESNFSTYPEALDYVKDTWLNQYKERFVAAWTDTCMHFGNTTSNRVESQREKLKRQLGASQVSFQTSWPNIHALLELQITDIKTSYEKSLGFVRHFLKHEELRKLRGFVSITALNMIMRELERVDSVGVDAFACRCNIRRTHGLPCAHEIAEYRHISQPIPLDVVHPHWRKLDLLDTPLILNAPCKDIECYNNV